MQPVRAAGVILFRDQPQRRFLLMRHPTRWDLPKGHVDPDEDDITCALREMHEETGIDPALVTLASDFRFETQYTVTYRETGDTPFLKTLVIFLGWLLDDVPIIHTEHQGSRWFTWDPPHHFDNPTIDPLLAQLTDYFTG
ncbi:MAG: bis(5'-nucleosyl)-tetraphosphatase [Chloroflexota bacterium]